MWHVAFLTLWVYVTVLATSNWLDRPHDRHPAVTTPKHTQCSACGVLIPFGVQCWLRATGKPTERVVVCSSCHAKKEVPAK